MRCCSVPLSSTSKREKRGSKQQEVVGLALRVLRAEPDASIGARNHPPPPAGHKQNSFEGFEEERETNSTSQYREREQGASNPFLLH
jgi:hypothetical protein